MIYKYIETDVYSDCCDAVMDVDTNRCLRCFEWCEPSTDEE